MSEDKEKSTVGAIGEGIGCLLVCIGIAVVIWAMSGFPGLR